MADPTEQAGPSGPSGPGGPSQPRARVEYATDEVSLRDLYLTFRAGLPLIAIVAVLAGVAAFAVISARPLSYTATAIVHVMPTVVTTGQFTDLTLTAPVGLDQDSYRALAFSQDVLTDGVARFDGALGELGIAAGTAPSTNGPPSAEVFANNGSLTSTAASQLTRGQQVAHHAFRARTPHAAAAGANAWAAATASAAQDLLTRPVRAALAAADSEQGARRQAFDEANAAWAEFLARDRRDELRTQLASLAARRAAITELLSAGTTDAAARAALEDQVVSAEARTSVLRSELAELEGEAARLQGDVTATLLAFERSSAAAAALDLQGYVLAEGAGLVVKAGAPLEPDPRNRVTVTAAAAIVAGLLATLLVFLRQAVREP